MDTTDPVLSHQTSESEIQQVRSALKSKAIELLARREYSVRELTGKLSNVSHSLPNSLFLSLIDELLEELQQAGYQSDTRFACMLVRHKANAGNGPLKISRELAMKGIPRALFDQAVEEEQIDFYDIAFNVMERRFTPEQVSDYSSYQKVFRFFANRGFTSDHIKYAKDTLLTDVS